MRPRRLVALALALPLATAVPAAAIAATLQPKLPDFTGIVKDPKWAVVLGKALFWDVSVGSDGMACASCHFHAGADARIKNALSPGLIELPESDTAFGATVALPPFALGATASGGTVDSTYTLDEDDFPFHQLADILNRNSALNITTNDVVSSAGAVDATFTRIRLRGPFDSCDEVSGDVFHAGAFAARQVEPRNTPTMINAVFNHRNFWDGRAMNDFSGVGVFGQADVLNNPARRLVVLQNGSLQLTSLNLPDSSLASQAVGPPLSNLEMSCGERAFPNIGRKLFGVLDRALSLQKVHPQDSVFGAPGPFGDLRGALPRGLAITHNYRNLVQRAFENKWWSAPGRFRITDAGALVPAPVLGFTQMELNFSMFWGIAIMLYEATLISDDSPFDRNELSEAAERGRVLFTTAGNACVVVAARAATLCRSGRRRPSSRVIRSFTTINPPPAVPPAPSRAGEQPGAPRPGLLPARRPAGSRGCRRGRHRPVWRSAVVLAQVDRGRHQPRRRHADHRRRLVQGATAPQRRAHAALLPQRRLCDPPSGGGVLPPRRQPARRCRPAQATIPAPAARVRTIRTGAPMPPARSTPSPSPTPISMTSSSS